LLEPQGLYRLGQLDGVITQFSLEQSLKGGKPVPTDVVFINCAGARGPDRTYCGRLCCAISIKNARLVKEQHPAATVTVLQRDVMALGATFETEYIKARESGVRFIRFDPDSPPVVEGETGVEGVRVYHQLYGEEITLPARTVVLTTPLVAQDDASELSKMLKVPLDKDGFFLEAHVKLRPVEFATEGVFIAGAARFPANLSESISQGTAAAAKAAAPMYRGEVLVEATTAATNPHLCSGCGGCEAICPFGAIEITPDKTGRPVSEVNPVMCKGCGACVANCPCCAIEQQGFTDLQIHSMVTSLSFDDRHDAPLDIPRRGK
jgi:heterodisulfide reductase subunit A